MLCKSVFQTAFRLTRQSISPLRAELYPLKLNFQKTTFNISLHLSSRLFPISNNCTIARYYMDLISVTKEFEQLAPLALAEKWDNVGILIDQSSPKNISSILFTNDLTRDVLSEAIELKVDLIYSYHPLIFSPLKSLKRSNWKEQIILSCAHHNIAIYSSHTAIDACDNGNNDWLISCFDLAFCCSPVQQSCDPSPKFTHVVECSIPSNQDVQALYQMSGVEITVIRSNEVNLTVQIKVQSAGLNDLVAYLNELLQGHAALVVTKYEPSPLLGCGIGRQGKLRVPIPISEAIDLVKAHVALKSLRIAYGKDCDSSTLVCSVAVCAGSGASVLKGVDADLYVTGEMSHHELLNATQGHKTVILCEHSNSERGFLTKLVHMFEPKLKDVKLHISKADKDPIVIE